jgi:c-di-GMP-binding flagellar brake protein YcgR
MSTVTIERRKFKRAYFSNQDCPVGTLVPAAKDHRSATAKIINISEGGIGFTLSKPDSEHFKKGERLILKEAAGGHDMGFLTDIEMEIRWTMNYPEFDNAGLGCEFIDPPQDLGENIRKFIETFSR